MAEEIEAQVEIKCECAGCKRGSGCLKELAEIDHKLAILANTDDLYKAFGKNVALQCKHSDKLGLEHFLKAMRNLYEDLEQELSKLHTGGKI